MMSSAVLRRKRALSPTGETPRKGTKKPLLPRSSNKPSQSKKKLSFEPEKELKSLLSAKSSGSACCSSTKYNPFSKWSDYEDETLVRFILLNCLGKEWPSEKKSRLWEGASKFLGDICKTKRSSISLYL